MQTQAASFPGFLRSSSRILGLSILLLTWLALGLSIVVPGISLSVCVKNPTLILPGVVSENDSPKSSPTSVLRSVNSLLIESKSS